MSKKVKQHKAIVPGNGMAVNVLGPAKEDLAFALKNWKRKVKSAGIVDILNERREYIKPSVTNRAQNIRAKYIQRMRSLNEKN
jgi:small subunit ribosomal protein S21